MSYDNLSSVSQNVLKFYQQPIGGERRIPFIFDDFHFCHSRVIGLDVTENRIFTLSGFDINFLTNLSIWASAILILLARNCKLLARILIKWHICM